MTNTSEASRTPHTKSRLGHDCPRTGYATASGRANTRPGGAVKHRGNRATCTLNDKRCEPLWC